MRIQAATYATAPAPTAQTSTMVAMRTMTGSMSRCLAMPPHTPPSMRSSRERAMRRGALWSLVSMPAWLRPGRSRTIGNRPYVRSPGGPSAGAGRRSVGGVRSPQGRRSKRRPGGANSDAERRALAKASGRRTGPPPRAPRPGDAGLSTDRGSRGNPGPAAIGYVLAAADGTVLAAHGEAIGVAGANVAEYRALLAGLEHAVRLGRHRVEARCDARLVVEQVTGAREAANPRLRELCDASREAAQRIGTVVFTWVPAEANGRAHPFVAEALAPRR